MHNCDITVWSSYLGKKFKRINYTSLSLRQFIKCMGLVVQRLDNAIHRINRYPVDKQTHHAIRWIVIFPVDSDIQPSNNPGTIFSLAF